MLQLFESEDFTMKIELVSSLKVLSGALLVAHHRILLANHVKARLQSDSHNEPNTYSEPFMPRYGRLRIHLVSYEYMQLTAFPF